MLAPVAPASSRTAFSVGLGESSSGSALAARPVVEPPIERFLGARRVGSPETGPAPETNCLPVRHHGHGQPRALGFGIRPERGGAEAGGGYVVQIKKGARIIGPARDTLTAELVRKYDNGASIRQLAQDTGRSYGFVHGLLAEAGVTLRGRGGNTRRKDK
jgi:Helix-turn-helix domain